MDRGKVAVSISERRVDLNGSCVALHCSLYVLHLFQSVAHVAVSISKIGVDTGGGGGRNIEFKE